MKHWPIHRQLFTWITLSLCLVAGLSAWIMLEYRERYHLEVTQAQHRTLAQYILEHLPEPLLLGPEQANRVALKGLAEHVMAINPSVEVYLLGVNGDVLGHALPESSIKLARLDTSALRAVEAATIDYPVLGPNPRAPERPTIFSVAPIEWEERFAGYLYVVLQGQDTASLGQQLAGNRVQTLSLLLLFVVLAAAALLSYWLLHRVTRPLRLLDHNTQRFSHPESDETKTELARPQTNEVDSLAEHIASMQQRIKEQFAQLNEADRLRRELVTNISHDLRTPLAALQGHLETLQLGEPALPEPEKARYLKIAYRHSQHLANLISQLFELSRLDSGDIELKTERFSILELLQDCAQEQELVLQQRGITLDIDMPPQDLIVEADIRLIQRVLQNLLSNALRYTPEKGHLLLSIDKGREGAIVRVIDSGPGIQSSELGRVFERCYRNPSAEHQSDSLSGDGLGLHIVSRILNLHSSSFRAYNTSKAGACFEFQLPDVSY